MASTLHLLTYDDLLQTPNDGNRYEIIGGELVMSPGPVPQHQEVSMRLTAAFLNAVERHGSGILYAAPTDFQLTPYDVVQPDLACISEARMGIIGDDFMNGAPDLIVEILSPSTRDRDLGRKAALYAAADVLEYWIVDMENQSVTVLSLIEGRYEELPPDWPMARSIVLPEIRLNIPDLFANLHRLLGSRLLVMTPNTNSQTAR